MERPRPAGPGARGDRTAVIAAAAAFLFAAPALIATATEAAATAAGRPVPAPAREVLAALLAAPRPPASLGELAAFLGPLARDPADPGEAFGPLHRPLSAAGLRAVRIELAIDIFHEEPGHPDPRLGRYDLELDPDLDFAELRALFAASPGPGAGSAAPTPLPRDGRAVLRRGPFYLVAPGPGESGAGGAVVAWYAAEPLFAVPLRSAEEERQLVARIAALAESGFRRAAVEAQMGPLVTDPASAREVVRAPTWTVELTPAGAEHPRRLTITFRRPLPGAELLRRLGVAEPRVASGDVHLQSRHVVDLARPFSAETGYALPAAGGHALSILVLDEALEPTAEETPGSPVWRSTRADGPLIRSLTALPPVESPAAARRR